MGFSEKQLAILKWPYSGKTALICDGAVRSGKQKDKGRAPQSVCTADAFSNPVFRLGYGTQSPLEATQYPTTRMTQNYALLNSLYRDNWIVQNIITTIPADMMREWITLTGVTPEAQKQFERAARRTQLRKRLTDGLHWGRLYGGALGVVLLRGQEDLAEPLDLDRVLPGCFMGLYLVDRWSGVYPEMELVTDMADPDFGLPKYYAVRVSAQGEAVQRVHHSRVVRFIGRELPYYEKIAEQYWGESELEAIYTELVKRDNVSHNMAALTFKARQEYQEMEGLDQLFSIGSQAQQERFWRTMQAQSVLQSNFGVRLVNKGDAIKTKEYTFSGLSDVYESVMMDVSGASRIPVTKLFGRSPAGLNATGEDEVCFHVGSDYGYTALKKKLVGLNNPNWYFVGIECCIDPADKPPADYGAAGKYMELGKPSGAQYDALVEFAADFLTRHGMTTDNLCRHYDITGKACPVWFVKDGARWETFKADVAEKMKGESSMTEEIKALVASMVKEGVARELAERDAAQAATAEKLSPWAKAEWAEAKRMGLMDGTRPGGSVTREQLAAVAVRQYKMLKEGV